jgi:hypothetical protein
MHLPPLPVVAPPIPAPYLTTIAPLPAELLGDRPLSREDRRRLRQAVEERKQQIFEARSRYEARHFVRIESEPTAMP